MSSSGLITLSVHVSLLCIDSRVTRVFRCRIAISLVIGEISRFSQCINSLMGCNREWGMIGLGVGGLGAAFFLLI